MGRSITLLLLRSRPKDQMEPLRHPFITRRLTALQHKIIQKIIHSPFTITFHHRDILRCTLRLNLHMSHHRFILQLNLFINSHDHRFIQLLNLLINLRHHRFIPQLNQCTNLDHQLPITNHRCILQFIPLRSQLTNH